jgi:hypothetical protein
MMCFSDAGRRERERDFHTRAIPDGRHQRRSVCRGRMASVRSKSASNDEAFANVCRVTANTALRNVVRPSKDTVTDLLLQGLPSCAGWPSELLAPRNAMSACSQADVSSPPIQPCKPWLEAPATSRAARQRPGAGSGAAARRALSSLSTPYRERPARRRQVWMQRGAGRSRAPSSVAAGAVGLTRSTGLLTAATAPQRSAPAQGQPACMHVEPVTPPEGLGRGLWDRALRCGRFACSTAAEMPRPRSCASLALSRSSALAMRTPEPLTPSSISCLRASARTSWTR